MENNHSISINPFETYLCDKASMTSTPISGTFELLPNCNMDCKMCYIRMTKSDVEKAGGLLPKDFWLNLADQAMKKGLLFLLLTGGEPLLYPDFFDLYKALMGKGLYLTVNTNGTLINEEIAKFFGEYCPRRLNITIYGKDDATYKTLCNNPKGFSQLERALYYLRRYNVPVKLNCSLTPYNYMQLDDMRKFAEKMGIPIEIGYYMMPPNRKLEKGQYDRHRLSPTLAAKAAFDIKMHSLTPEERKETAKEILEKMHSSKLEEKPKCGFWCRAGNCSFWINWQGKMVPCGMLNEPCYSIEEHGFENAWDIMSKDVRKISLSSKCYYCDKRSICMHCAATENAETGGFGCSPAYLCKLSEVYLELIEKEALS